MKDMEAGERDWVEGLEREGIVVKDGEFVTVKNKTVLSCLQ